MEIKESRIKVFINFLHKIYGFIIAQEYIDVNKDITKYYTHNSIKTVFFGLKIKKILTFYRKTVYKTHRCIYTIRRKYGKKGKRYRKHGEFTPYT